jgi:hypothetical protein
LLGFRRLWQEPALSDQIKTFENAHQERQKA